MQVDSCVRSLQQAMLVPAWLSDVQHMGGDLQLRPVAAQPLRDQALSGGHLSGSVHNCTAFSCGSVARAQVYHSITLLAILHQAHREQRQHQATHFDQHSVQRGRIYKGTALHQFGRAGEPLPRIVLLA